MTPKCEVKVWAGVDAHGVCLFGEREEIIKRFSTPEEAFGLADRLRICALAVQNLEKRDDV